MNIAKQIYQLLSANSTTILTTVSVAGVVSTSCLAVDATLKSHHLREDPDTKKHVWKYYIPAVGTGVITIITILAAHKINAKKSAALASLYSLSQSSLKEYQAKVEETIGATKATKIRDEIAKDHIAENPLRANEIILTGNGEVVCYDSLSGRYFKSCIEKIKQTVNELNYTLLHEDFVSLNDLYYELGLAGTKLGDILGWRVDSGLITVTFSTQLTEDNAPCIVLNFDVSPKHL